MKRRPFHVHHPFGHVNVTPLIDVVMVMIVFYLIVGKLAADRRAEVRLPESRVGQTDAARPTLVINVLRRDGDAPARVVVQDRPVTVESLDGVIRERLADQPHTAVQVRADRSLPYGDVAPILAACRRAGVPTVRLATERGP